GAPAAPDTTAPVLVKVTLPKETTTQAVAVAIDATDAVGVAQVRFANEDGTWTAWQPFTNPKTWTLTAGYTPKLVYVQVRDAVGNESLVLTSTTKYVKTVAGPVDNAAPVLTAITIANPTPTAAVTVKLTATDDVAVTQVRFANEDGNWGAWGAFAAEVPHTLTVGNTNKVVYGQVRDAAGRESAVLFTKTLVKP
ncbi:MAG: Ig-like surface protein, partial [Thermoleophilia bacterium]|nr:Ig-like surface protein [Thermoleophilia bacterium]